MNNIHKTITILGKIDKTKDVKIRIALLNQVKQLIQTQLHDEREINGTK
jgi:hypothetical protein